MNRHQLRAALREAGVGDSRYGIMTPDLRTSEHIQESVPVLVGAPDQSWAIEAWERGDHWVEASFDSEEAACAYLYDRLVKH
ncbi:hypothetical protein C7C46_20475 [Streptomyces tateyamensis]|uniref:Uncharacterized protein n=1 Tax=Streptomyces tateyamensis TaxID=565073 RepID=A0A2V4MZW9_9ACTN|nr:hypothetical protein [Streptomyces tateyamensis]PYC77007.1 hypothetical protein C7C46_20475 [Streptomyces tateyamensis]